MRVHLLRLEFDIIILPFVRDEALSRFKGSSVERLTLAAHLKTCGTYSINVSFHIFSELSVTDVPDHIATTSASSFCPSKESCNCQVTMAAANQSLELNVIANSTTDRIKGLSENDGLFELNTTYPQTMIFNRCPTVWGKAIPYLEGEIRICNEIVDKIIQNEPRPGHNEEKWTELGKAMNDLINAGLLLGNYFLLLKNTFTVDETRVTTSS